MAGHIEVEGKAVKIKNPQDALDAGIAYLTEDRKGLGLFLDMSIEQNINVAVIAHDAKSGGFLNAAEAKRRTEAAVKELSIRARSTSLNVGSLSGGAIRN